MSQNLEALIEEHAKIMAEQMVKAAKFAGSEEDVRHACNRQIDEFIRKAGLTVQGRHEYGLAGGRIDSKYGGVVIEYKDPKSAGKITDNKNAPGAKAVVEQLNKRFRDFQTEENVGLGASAGRLPRQHKTALGRIQFIHALWGRGAFGRRQEGYLHVVYVLIGGQLSGRRRKTWFRYYAEYFQNSRGRRRL